jgi:hypothetical protein
LLPSLHPASLVPVQMITFVSLTADSTPGGAIADSLEVLFATAFAGVATGPEADGENEQPVRRTKANRMVRKLDMC